MPTQIFRARYKLGLRGITPNNQHTIDFLMRSDMLRTSPGWDVLATATGTVLRSILCTPVTIIGVVFSPVNRPKTPQPARGSHIPKLLNLTGQRTTASSATVGLDQVVALFPKDGGFGNTGVQKIRGAVFSDEFTSDATGGITTKSPFSVTPFNAFGTAFIAACSNNGAPLVLPAPLSENWITDARLVIKMQYGGLSLHDTDKQSKSIRAEQDNVIKRTLRQIQSDYNRASKDELGNPIQVPPAVITELVRIFINLVSQYTMGRIIRLALPPVVRTVILPALPPSS